jgi:hypothetical protein
MDDRLLLVMLFLGLGYFLSYALNLIKECFDRIETILKRIEKGQTSEFERDELNRRLEHLETILEDIRINLPT